MWKRPGAAHSRLVARIAFYLIVIRHFIVSWHAHHNCFYFEPLPILLLLPLLVAGTGALERRLDLFPSWGVVKRNSTRQNTKIVTGCFDHRFHSLFCLSFAVYPSRYLAGEWNSRSLKMLICCSAIRPLFHLLLVRDAYRRYCDRES